MTSPRQDDGLVDQVSDAIDDLVQAVKPRMRGWLHQGFTPVILLAALALVALAPTLTLRSACAVYLLCGVLLFGNSAFYHRGNWTPRVKATFRRIDHANIFVFIAGSYTPLATGMLTGRSRTTLLVLIWTCALVGVLFRVLWLSAPRWLYVALYVGMGWAAVAWMGQFWNAGGPLVVGLIALGGVIYTIGAVVYGRKRPDPWPEVFGFHEIFHLCTVLAAVAHYIAIALVVLR